MMSDSRIIIQFGMLKESTKRDPPYETNDFFGDWGRGFARVLGLRQKDIRRPQTEGRGCETEGREESERGKGSCRQANRESEAEARGIGGQSKRGDERRAAGT